MKNLTKKTHVRSDRRDKILLFLSIYTVFTLTKIIDSLTAFNSVPEMAGHIMTGILWLTTVIITMATSKRKIFHSKAVIFFFTGVSLWCIWGAFTNFSRISLVSSTNVYAKIFALFLFTHALFLSARIIEIYSLRRQIMKINVFCIGFILLFAYIVYFNGFSFLNYISGIFRGGGRYRFAYGFTHVNFAGRTCLQFLIFSAIYQAILEEEAHLHKHTAGLYRYIMIPVAMMILLTSASRASMSGLILFWTTYFTLSYFKQIKFFVITLGISFVIFIAFVIDLDSLLLWNLFMSGRGFYYSNAFSFMSDHNIWFTGIGLMRHSEVMAIAQLRWLDSVYLKTLLQTGWIGFFIFFGTIFILAFIYFKDIIHMSKLQKLIGAIIITILFYGILEGMFFGTGPFDFSNWLMIILCMNDRSKVHAHIHSDKHSRT